MDDLADLDDIPTPPRLEAEVAELLQSRGALIATERTWHTCAEACLLHPEKLNQWEREFLPNILKYTVISPKQLVCLQRALYKIQSTPTEQTVRRRIKR